MKIRQSDRIDHAHLLQRMISVVQKRAKYGFGLIIALCAITTIALTGCAATGQARSVKKSGFLGADYARLKEGSAPKAKLWYSDKNAAWKSYDKILLDPVTMWTAPGEKLGISHTDAQKVANNFSRKLHESLSRDYQIVSSPQPGTLRIQFAITRVSDADTTMNVVSTAIPQLRAATSLEGYAAGKPLFTGEIAIEMKTTDATTGQLLQAAVDKRVGEKQLSDSFDSWAAVNQSIAYWAELERYWLCTYRGGSDCQLPEVKTGF